MCSLAIFLLPNTSCAPHFSGWFWGAQGEADPQFKGSLLLSRHHGPCGGYRGDWKQPWDVATGGRALDLTLSSSVFWRSSLNRRKDGTAPPLTAGRALPCVTPTVTRPSLPGLPGLEGTLRPWHWETDLRVKSGVGEPVPEQPLGAPQVWAAVLGEGVRFFSSFSNNKNNKVSSRFLSMMI